jgi:hypothetical protein
MRHLIVLIAFFMLTGCDNPLSKDDYSEYDARDVVVTSPTDFHQLGVFRLTCETRYDGDTSDAKWSRTDAVFTNTGSSTLSFNFNIYGISEGNGNWWYNNAVNALPPGGRASYSSITTMPHPFDSVNATNTGPIIEAEPTPPTGNG